MSRLKRFCSIFKSRTDLQTITWSSLVHYEEPEANLQASINADWNLQEMRKYRKPDPKGGKITGTYPMTLKLNSKTN